MGYGHEKHVGHVSVMASAAVYRKARVSQFDPLTRGGENLRSGDRLSRCFLSGIRFTDGLRLRRRGAKDGELGRLRSSSLLLLTGEGV